MFASIWHGKPLVNGYSGFTPASYVDNARALGAFPDERSHARLRELGVTHVVVHLDTYGRRRLALQAALSDTTWLRLVAAERDVRLYRIRD